MVQKLAHYGEPFGETDGEVLRAFPTPERIAAIPEAELRQAGFGYRGRSIPMAASQISHKPADWLESLRLRPYSEVHEELKTLEGVGPKLADCVALYGLEKLESAPIDTHLWQAICRHYFPEWQDKAVTDARYKAAGDFMRERFGDLAGIAHQFLYFENLRNWRSRR